MQRHSLVAKIFRITSHEVGVTSCARVCCCRGHSRATTRFCSTADSSTGEALHNRSEPPRYSKASHEGATLRLSVNRSIVGSLKASCDSVSAGYDSDHSRPSSHTYDHVEPLLPLQAEAQYLNPLATPVLIPRSARAYTSGSDATRTTASCSARHTKWSEFIKRARSGLLRSRTSQAHRASAA